MNFDSPTKQISLNLVAICVFGMTISSLVAPLLKIDSTLPIAIVFGIFIVATLDNFCFNSTLATLVLDTIASRDPAYRQRIIEHEAGHFLVAYLLGIPISGYTIGAWESLRAGYPAQGGTIFAPPTADLSAQTLQNYYTMWMAGIAAEKIIYNRAEGGSEDRQKLRSVLFKLGKQQQELIQQENLATMRAKLSLQTNWEAYQALVIAMCDRQSVEDCCLQIEAKKLKVAIN